MPNQKNDMKTKALAFLTVLLYAAWLNPLMANAQMFSETRVESRSFRLKPGIEVQVYNKYGNVNVMSWEKDSVRFEVSISVRSKQQEKLNKIISSIDCEMVSTATFISARTIFHDNSTTFWKDVVSYAGKLINTGNNLQINYTVYLPADNPVKVSNKFGNIYMDSFRANVDINLANGDMQARDFSGIFKLKLEYGSAMLQETGHSQIDISYSELSVQQAANITLNSRSSTINLEKVNILELNSVRDKINVKSCTAVNGDASFSRIQINSLESGCTLRTKYGELKLNKVSRNFRNIYIRSEYTDVACFLNRQSSYSVDLNYDAKTMLNIPMSVDSRLKKETLNAAAGTMKAYGEFGHSGGAQVTLSLKSGSLTLLND